MGIGREEPRQAIIHKRVQQSVTLIMTEEEIQKAKFTEEEILNSKRIFKSATPKYTLDWYVKWVASIVILISLYAFSRA